MPQKETSFDRVIAIVRDRSGLSQNALAGKLGVTKQTLTGFKSRGRFPTKTIRKISNVTKIPIAEFQPIITDEINELSRKLRLSIADTQTLLICIGLDNFKHYEKD